MVASLLPCKYCRTLVPRFTLEEDEFQAIVRALSNGSKTLAAGELKYFAHCQDSEAQTWVDHLLCCVHAWPNTKIDQQVLQLIDQAFDGIPKPEHFTDHTHCDECEEHDQTLRRRTRETLRREDLGNLGWDPITFSSEEGIAYFFPALARFALVPDVWIQHGWYGIQLLSHLSYESGINRFLAWCSPRQREAVYALLEHLSDTRMSTIVNTMCEQELQTARSTWQPPNLTFERDAAKARRPSTLR